MSAAPNGHLEAIDVLASIVVPTRDRPEQAARCVRALLEQNPPFRFEVLVVDDGRARPFDISAFAREDAPVAVLQTRQAGPAAARNAGVAAARGAYVCFIDDDCVPEPGWLEHITEAAAATPWTVVSGETINAFPTRSLAEASQYVTNFLAQPDEPSSTTLRFAPSSNICCARGIATHLPFDVRFPAAAGEDRDWCARVIEAGHPIRMTQGAPVIHHQRLRLRTFWRQHRRYGRGGFDFRHLHGGAWHLAEPSFYVRLIVGAFRIRTSVGLLVLLAQVATAVGYIAEAIDQLTSSSSSPNAAQRAIATDGSGNGEYENQDRGAEEQADSLQPTLPFPVALRLPPPRGSGDGAPGETTVEEPRAADGVV